MRSLSSPRSPFFRAPDARKSASPTLPIPHLDPWETLDTYRHAGHERKHGHWEPALPPPPKPPPAGSLRLPEFANRRLIAATAASGALRRALDERWADSRSPQPERRKPKLWIKRANSSILESSAKRAPIVRVDRSRTAQPAKARFPGGAGFGEKGMARNQASRHGVKNFRDNTGRQKTSGRVSMKRVGSLHRARFR